MAKNKSELLRFVLSPERELVFDLHAKLPGRGSYTCIKTDCIRIALEKRSFQRAFKGEMTLPGVDPFISEIISRVKDRIGSYISLANKAGKVVSGSDMVNEAIKRGKTGFVFIASDISADIGGKILELTKRTGIPSRTIFDKEILGALIGKGLRSVVAVEQSGFVEAIRNEVAKYGNFLEGEVDAR
jgi:ribosomal protein L7Ae-like RNA K-turn-binding protein